MVCLLIYLLSLNKNRNNYNQVLLASNLSNYARIYCVCVLVYQLALTRAVTFHQYYLTHT